MEIKIKYCKNQWFISYFVCDHLKIIYGKYLETYIHTDKCNIEGRTTYLLSTAVKIFCIDE